MHTVIGATVLCAALLFIAFLSIRWVLQTDYRAGRKAFERGEALNARWSTEKQTGWSAAWGEQLKARLGHRGGR